MYAAERAGAQDLKAQGNDSFKLRNFPDAIRKYTGTLDILNQLDGASTSCSAQRAPLATGVLTLVGTEECGRIEDYNNPVVKDRWALRATALSNRSECYLQMKKWKLAQADAEAALEIDRFVRINISVESTTGSWIVLFLTGQCLGASIE